MHRFFRYPFLPHVPYLFSFRTAKSFLRPAQDSFSRGTSDRQWQPTDPHPMLPTVTGGSNSIIDVYSAAADQLAADYEAIDPAGCKIARDNDPLRGDFRVQ